MHIHEWQAKDLFKEFGIPVAKGIVSKDPNDFQQCVNQLSSEKIVVKSQIHAGGRGQGTFQDGYKGGVKMASSKEEAITIAKRMFGNVLVTKQTGPKGQKVSALYFTEACNIQKEYYVAILLNRATARPNLIVSTEGGMEIEQVSKTAPEKIIQLEIHPSLGLRPHQARECAFLLGLSGDLFKQMTALLTNLYHLYWEMDASMVEINPLSLTPKGELFALDAKVTFDDNSLYRHPKIQALRDLNEEDPKEIEASKFQLSYVALQGDIACLVNGAGLAMATMDIIKYYGGTPANFLDVGGGADEEQVTAAFKIILSDSAVKGILINIFGGIMKCDIVARSIIAAAKKVQITLPIVLRLEGTNVELARHLLSESKLSITTVETMAEAAKKIIFLTNNPLSK